MKTRLQELYREKIVPEIMRKFSYKNPLQVARIEKIVVNMGVGEAITDIKILEAASKDLSMITGQKPIICRAKKAVSNFKIKKGNPIGCKVTLRGIIMYEFLDRLINVALPRIRDFRGLNPNSFDGEGNFNLGINDQSIFPEVESDKITHTQGLDINIVTTIKKKKEEALELLREFGMPFQIKPVLGDSDVNITRT